MINQKLHIAILASPGLGHLIPVLILGNRLATDHGAKVTVLVNKTSSSVESQVLNNLASGPNMDILEIPPVNISHLIDADTKAVAKICIMVREALPFIRSAIAGMKDGHRPDILISDLFCTEAFSIATEFNMPKYVYVPTSAWHVALKMYSPVLDKQIEGQYVDQTEPLKIPGCKSIRPEDVVEPMVDRNDQQYRELVRMGREFSTGDGILINTWEDLEQVTLEAFRENESLREVIMSTVYPIGPLTRPGEPKGPNRENHELMEWLDMQPCESVLYVSFGSGGTLSAEQLIELAWGLEISQQRFIWVVRPPARIADGSFFTSGSGSSDGTPDYLPEGFLGRTKNLGLIVSQWAPQVEILSHPSVGGFLTHCGWSSTLESLKNGVPMIVWPLYAEQRLNATMLAEELGVAVRPKVLPTKKVVDRKEIEEMVRTIMASEKGKLIRERVKQVKISALDAIQEGGSSVNAMRDFLKDVTVRLNMRS
ncbi:OLC1v1010789C1 [Oldenlandia corymbosa var. corymbosa]|uniref:Glycosyltransferase n=1 Tax=Oldenlandia corymbosa var. corymbosa TaxID=529605 RepID=A0AAV1DS65_OLDCO|nr:OLC1v1010789C1 [Oldenlandia corymbosa var. corymbosa]